MILVSGANGFLGQALIKQLLNRGYKVIGLVFDSAGTLLKDKNLNYIRLDITKQKEFKKLSEIKNIEVIFHTAAYISFGDDIITIKNCFEVNILGTVNLLEFCSKKNIKKFIFSSTAAVYNSSNKSPTKESDSVSPDNFYGQTKLTAEYFCSYYNKTYGIDTTILRYSGLYGRNDRPINAINIFIRQAVKGEDILIYNKGSQIRDWTYVEDAAMANMKSFELGKSGIFNISSGKGLKIKEAADLIKKTLGSSSRIISANTKKSTSPDKIIYDISKARKELKFIPTPLGKALEEIHRVK